LESSQMNQTWRKRQAVIATQIVREVADAVARKQPADAALAAIFRRERGYGGRDRRMYAHAVFSFFRWRGWVLRLAPEELARQIALALMIDPETPDIVRDAWRSIAGMDEAILKSLAEFDADTMTAHGLSRDDLMPDWLPTVMPGYEERAAFIASCCHRPPTWLVVPEDRLTAFGDFLSQQNLRFTIDQRIAGAIALHDRFHLETLEKKWGQAIQVQDIASQAVVKACDVQPGETWLDVCAGSGGKSLGLARATGPDGRVTALDIRPTVMRNLERRAAGHGFANLRGLVADATAYTTEPVFDGVLVDAPCSGLGTWPRNPDARWRTDLADVKTAAEKQNALMNQATGFLKPGGKLVYSICTMTSTEGHELVAQLNATHVNFKTATLVHPLSGMPCEGQTQIHPAEGPGDGMFIAVWKA
jgi:16S rRNA (cytosine967-C5)-methyltransferase